MIKVGDRVIDIGKQTGIVVKIIPHNPANPIEEHGTIYVWQDSRTGYGDDNCEHYCHSNWQSILKIIG